MPMPVDPQAQLILDQLKHMPQIGPDTKPTKVRQTYARLPLPEEPVHAIVNRTIPGPAGDIPVRIYTPSDQTPLPALVYYHGGGWVIGDLDSHDDLCRFLANQTGCSVISVDYRLAPEHKFPAAVDDAFAALQWVHAHAEDIAIDRDRIAVAGDSAGGNLAAVVSILARDAGGPIPAAQVLIYPATAAHETFPSRLQFGEGFLLTESSMRWFAGHYLNDAAELTDFRVSPLVADNLQHLPPAFIITGEYDPLRDEGEAYAARLKEAGVPVTCNRYDGMIHDFVRLLRVIQKGRSAAQDAADFLKQVFFA